MNIYDIDYNIIGEVIINNGYRYSIIYGNNEYKVFRSSVNTKCCMRKAFVFNSLSEARIFAGKQKKEVL
jgi:hypothetical protein